MMSGMPEVRHFRARIQKQGLNPWVQVPGDVSHALQDFARSGRISVEGVLNDTVFHTTLMPIAGGGHRLFVNGGVRKAAGVAVGDRVTISLRPVDPGSSVPGDLESHLESLPGAPKAFLSLSPSHRRELIRYLEDARSRAARTQRIERIANHLLGKERPARRAKRVRSRPLWTCPRCGNRFVNKNQYHACGRFSVEEVFRDKPAEIRKLFDHFRKLVESCGPVTLVPYRDKVGFMVRVRFAGATPRRRWLDIGFWLTRRVDDPRFRRVETIYPNVHLHWLRVTETGQLDEQLAAWLEEAYACGRQEHLG